MVSPNRQWRRCRISTASHLLRYDVEVSGFQSSHAGHICLLRLKDQDYPGTKIVDDWPSWDLPIFRWAKKQGGVVGFAHSGWGLDVGATRKLPNYIVPPMNSIGANEYLVDVAHDACDFISTVDTPATNVAPRSVSTPTDAPLLPWTWTLV